MTRKAKQDDAPSAPKITLRPPCSLKPNPRNPRTHSPAQIDKIAASIERFGFRNPVLIDGADNVVAGHGRLLAAQKLGLAEVPCITLDGMTPMELRAYLLADNRLAEMADWDKDLLLGELTTLNVDGFPLELIGFSTDDLGCNVQNGDDDVPEESSVIVSKPGDLWILGDHRIICGDSRDPAILSRLMDGATAALYATDPPYGVGYDGTNHPQNQRDKAEGREPGAQNRDWSAEYWDHYADAAEFEQMLVDVFTAARAHVAEDAAWYCWHASATAQSFLKAWERVGIRYHQTITWVKPTAVLGFCMWNYRTEPCLMGWRQGHKPEALAVPDERSNCWEVDWEGRARCTDGLHPTQKPTRLFELPMLKHTRPGAICLETFSGSGSQIIAAERLGRRCFAVERLPQFVDAAVMRWQNVTGMDAVRADSGVTFNSLAEAGG